MIVFVAKALRLKLVRRQGQGNPSHRQQAWPKSTSARFAKSRLKRTKRRPGSLARTPFHKVCVDEYMAVHELGGDLSLVRCPECRHGGRPLVPEPPPEFLEASEVAELFEERPVAAEAALLEELLAVPAVAAYAEEANAAVAAVAAAEAAAEAAVAAREPPIVVVDEDDFEDRMQIKTNKHKNGPSPNVFPPPVLKL